MRSIAAALLLALTLATPAQAETVLIFPPGGFIERQPVRYAKQAARDSGLRPVVAKYPLHDLPRAVAYSMRFVQHHPHASAIGFSAGGILVADLAAYGMVDRAVSVGAPSNLVRWDCNPSYFGDSDATSHWDLVPATLRERRAASPTTAFRHFGPHPDLLTIHSRDDGIVPFGQAERLARLSGGPLVEETGVHGSYFESAATRSMGWLR